MWAVCCLQKSQVAINILFGVTSMKVVAYIVLRPIAAPLRVSMEMYVVHSHNM